MSIRKQATRGGVLALGISLVAVLAFAWGQVNPHGAQAVAEGPAMSLDAPGTVFMGVTFQVTMSADPAPDVEFAGFGSEVIWVGPNQEDPRDGLKWEQRVPGDAEASCLAEIQVGRVGGGSIALCNSFVPILTSGAAHAVLSQFTQPAGALDVAAGSTTPLLELDFVCNTPGSYTLVLTAVPDSPDGALFGGTDGAEIGIKTVEHDTAQVADTLTIECTDEPPPTDTPEPTDVPQATDTPEATAEPTVGGPITGVAGGTGDSGTSAGIWVLIGALLVASLTGMTVYGWKRIQVR